MFITFIIIVFLCLFAFGFFYMFSNRTAERDIRVHGGDAFEAAYARPRDKLLVKKALLQENNLLDLVTAKGNRVQRETGLSEEVDKQGELVMRRELRQHKHFAELAELDTEQIAHRLKGERLQIEHYQSFQRQLGSGSKRNEPSNPAMKGFKDQADYLVNFQKWNAENVAQYGQAVADELKQEMQRWADNQDFSQE